MGERVRGAGAEARGWVFARGLVAVLVLSGSTAFPLAGQSDEPPVASGPDAIVLSTGAARGLAHAGALLGLERHGFDPDLVVGASMGAVIGALYASGYSAEEIWDIALTTRWADLFISSPVLEGPDRRLLFPSLAIGLELGRLEVSSGVIPDWRVNRLLVHLLFDAGARARSDFDRLPRRYRAVAADLLTGQEVVLARGDLARAVRVSMSTPGFFSAVNWGGRLLIDGGIANYLPVSVARSLGAGRIVAVDVSRATKEVRGTDPTAIGGRSISLLMRNAMRDTVAPDVLVEPPLDPDFPGAMFPERPLRLLDVGRTAAVATAVAPTPEGPRVRHRSSAPDTLVALEIEVDDPALAALVRRAFQGLTPGPYRPDAVLARIDHLYASGLFTGVWPRVEARAGGGDVLVLALDPLPRLALTGAVGYDNDSGGRLWAAVESRASLLGSPVVTRAGAGTDGIQRWFEVSALLRPSLLPRVALTAGLDHRRGTPPFFGSLPVAPETRHTGGWAGVQYRAAFPDLIGSLVMRAERIAEKGGFEGQAWGPLLRISMPNGPARVVGIPSELEAAMWRGVVDYHELGARGSITREMGPLEFAALADAGFVVGDAPLDALPSLGDDHGMPGLRRGQKRGRARLLGGIDLAMPLVGGGWGRLRLRGGAAGERSELDERAAWLGGAALDLVWNTPFGPVVVGYGINTMSQHRIDVGLGAAF